MTNRKSAKINVLSVRVTNERLDEIEVEAAREKMTRTAYIQYLIDLPIRPRQQCHLCAVKLMDVLDQCDGSPGFLA